MSKKPFSVLRGILGVLRAIGIILALVSFVVLLNLADNAFAWFKWVTCSVSILIIAAALVIAFVMEGSPDEDEESAGAEKEKQDG